MHYENVELNDIFQDILIYNSIYQVIIDFDREGTSVNCVQIPDTYDMSNT